MSLSSLLVQREIATVREVEEAQAHQIIHGGDFVTNLLEVTSASESRVLPLVAQSYGLMAAPFGELPPAGAEARRLVTAVVATERSVIPLEVGPQGLVLAVSEPLTADAARQLAFVLATPVVQRIALFVRIRQALARDYGLPLEPRYVALLARLSGSAGEGGAGPHSTRTDSTRPVESSPARAVRRWRGPLTIAAAKSELEDASHGDRILDIVFEFARQSFDYTALLIVRGNDAFGRDAFGEGASREQVLELRVSLHEPGLFATARRLGEMVCQIPNGPRDRALMLSLGRNGLTECAVLPICVRRRAVAFVVGDGGRAGIDQPALADVRALTRSASFAFERLLVLKRRSAFPPARNPSAAPPAVKKSPSARVAAYAVGGGDAGGPSGDDSPGGDAWLDRPSLDAPPPSNLLSVRSLSGAPIPREDPPLAGARLGGLGVRPRPSKPPVPTSSSQPPPSSLPKSRRGRAEAPPLEFGQKRPISSFFPADLDEVEQSLLEEIRGEDDGGRKTLVSAQGPGGVRTSLPPSERQVSVPPHKPPSSRTPRSASLRSVIVDVPGDYSVLVDRFVTHGGQDAESELLRVGGSAMPALMARFPGPTVDLGSLGTDGPLPPVGECGHVLRVIVAQRRAALPFVLLAVDDPDATRRFWATYLLSELAYHDASDAIFRRLFDADGRVRRAARAAARAVGEASPQRLVDLLAAKIQESPEDAEWAIETLCSMREPLGVPIMIAALEKGAPALVSAARSALVVVTRQDFGLNASSWTAWWQENQARHRIEWLIDALMSEHALVRAAAGEEVKLLTGEYFGYYDDLPKREREKAQGRYRHWWASVGKARFASRATT